MRHCPRVLHNLSKDIVNTINIVFVTSSDASKLFQKIHDRNHFDLCHKKMMRACQFVKWLLMVFKWTSLLKLDTKLRCGRLWPWKCDENLASRYWLRQVCESRCFKFTNMIWNLDKRYIRIKAMNFFKRDLSLKVKDSQFVKIFCHSKDDQLKTSFQS